MEWNGLVVGKEGKEGGREEGGFLRGGVCVGGLGQSR